MTEDDVLFGFRQIGPVSVGCDGLYLEAGRQRETCPVAEGQPLTFRAWPKVCSLDAILFREGLDPKPAIGAVDGLPDRGHSRPHMLSSLGQLGQHLGEVDGADGGACFDCPDHRSGSRLVLQQGEQC